MVKMPEIKSTDIKNEDAGHESEVCMAFRQYAAELDARHDRHERLVKISRDVTIESKRIIFFLHSLIKSEDREAGLDAAEKRVRALVSGGLLRAAGESRAGGYYPLSNGLQELTEALCLLQHLRKPTICELPHWTQLASYTSGSENMENLRSLLNPMDFMLGVADYTGELMRLCINSVAAGDLDACFIIKDIMQHLYSGFLGFKSNCHRDMPHKLSTLRQSVLKVEAACCSLKLRGQQAFLLSSD